MNQEHAMGTSTQALTSTEARIRNPDLRQSAEEIFRATRARELFAGLLLLSLGCALRVSCEVLAYQGCAAWSVVRVTGFRFAGVSGAHDICDQHFGYVCPGAQPRLQSARCGGNL